jgi:hypothetical protein
VGAPDRTRRVTRLVAGLLVAATVAPGCGGPSQEDLEEATSADESGGIDAQVGQVLLRDVSLDEPDDGDYAPGDVARLRVVLLNQAPAPDALTAVASPAAAAARLLVDADCDGQVEELGRIPLPPQPEKRTPQAGAPDGPEPYYRVDLKLDGQVAAGESVSVSFTFERAGMTTLQVPVEQAGAPHDDAECEPAGSLS